MSKKVIAFGGGTGLSCLLKGLKQYPMDITAVVSVSDDGGSAGALRDEFNILAVGDIRRVLVALSTNEGTFEELFNYRFSSMGTLNKHTIGNLILTAQTNISGSIQKAIEDLSSFFNLKGKVLPFTEDNNLTLIAKMSDGKIVEGEHNITQYPHKILQVGYKNPPIINEELLYEIKNADEIVLSMGSLYTSVIPNLISDEIRNAIDESHAKIIYCCNLFTQPGETEEYTVSDHLKVLNSYLGNRKIEYVIANEGELDKELVQKYANEEQKDPVILDAENIERLGVQIIADDLVYIKEDSKSKKDVLRHNYMKLGYLIHSLSLNYDYMLRQKKKID